MFSPSGVTLDRGAISLSGGGAVERFVGVYSGRVHDESDLGRVWKVSAVGAVVEQGKRSELIDEIGRLQDDTADAIDDAG